jgi:hypothetical protein
VVLAKECIELLNKIPGIYAAVCWDEISAKLAKEHGNVNVLCFGGRTVKPELAKKMVKIWLETPFIPEERHVRRINKIKKIEEKYMKLKLLPPWKLLFYPIFGPTNEQFSINFNFCFIWKGENKNAIGLWNYFFTFFCLDF